MIHAVRVLFSCTAADGHFLPLVPLARAAAAAGHEVAFATSADYHARPRELGFEALAAGIGLDELERRFAATRNELRAGDLPIAERRARAFTGRFAEIEAPAKHPALREVAQRWRPDMLVHESCDLAGPLVAAELGLPSAHHSFGRLIPEPALRRAAETLAPLWRGAGLEADSLAGAYRGTYVDICPPALQDASPPDGTPVQPLRPVERVHGEKRDPPLVYVTLGTIFNRVELFHDLLAAFAPLPCDVVLTAGANVDPADLDPLPRNTVVHRYVPQAEILPHASAVVAHGGSGSTWGALAHGCPLVLVPQGADQFENALAVAHAGAGIALLPGRQSVEELRSALTAVLADERYTRAAEAIADEIASLPSAETAAAALFGA